MEEDTSSDEDVKPQAVDSPADPAPSHSEQSASTEPPGRKSKKRRRRGFSRFKAKVNGTSKNKYLKLVSPSKSKRKPRQVRPKPKPINKDEWEDFDVTKVLEAAHRLMISNFYLIVLGAPPLEDWQGPGEAGSKIVEALKPRKSQRQKSAERHRWNSPCIAHWRGRLFGSVGSSQS